MQRYAWRWRVAAAVAAALLLAGCGGVNRQGEVRGAPGGSAAAAWVGPLVKLDGRIYVLSKEPPIDAGRLGPELGRVARRLDREGDLRDGDSNFLPAGTPVYAIRGVDPAEAVAVPHAGAYRVLRTGLGPEGVGTLE